MDRSNRKDSPTVYGIVVSYNPSVELYAHLRTLINQVSKIIVFDNNSSIDSLPVVRKCEQINNVDVIYSDTNIGLSKAQNIAIKQALKAGADWILTLDDDSDISNSFVANMLLKIKIQIRLQILFCRGKSLEKSLQELPR